MMNCPECKHELVNIGSDRVNIGYIFFKVCPVCEVKFKTLRAEGQTEVIQFKLKNYRATRLEMIARQIKDAGQVDAFRREYLKGPVKQVAAKYQIHRRQVPIVAALLQIERVRKRGIRPKKKEPDRLTPQGGCKHCPQLSYCSEHHAGGVGILPCEVSCDLDENPVLYDASPGLNMTRPISVEIELRIAA